ncbi:MAG: D-lyxose/D-mannose family sugar isomerase [Rhodothermales bacterium]
MTRSDINSIIEEADVFLRKQNFFLPPFAYWTPQDWRRKSVDVREIVDRRLGWDITDFGSGDFKNVGLFLFTLRNGDPTDLGKARGKLYAEKVLIVNPEQATPLHLHKTKTEDIINRGGGRLAIKLYNSAVDGGLEPSDVCVNLDGETRSLPAGSTVLLAPGESITLPDGLYHEFWGEGDRVLVGEVSLANDDATDNYFYEGVGRFPSIEEDVDPLYLLVNDYERYVTFLR